MIPAVILAKILNRILSKIPVVILTKVLVVNFSKIRAKIPIVILTRILAKISLLIIKRHSCQDSHSNSY